MDDLEEVLDQIFQGNWSIEEKDLNNCNSEVEKLKSLSDQELKVLRGDLEGELFHWEQVKRFAMYMEHKPQDYKFTPEDAQDAIDYTLYKIDTVDSVYKQRVEARGEVYTDTYFCY